MYDDSIIANLGGYRQGWVEEGLNVCGILISVINYLK